MGLKWWQIYYEQIELNNTQPSSAFSVTINHILYSSHLSYG